MGVTEKGKSVNRQTLLQVDSVKTPLSVAGALPRTTIGNVTLS
ncbi:hypothetical protein [Citrobacter freundii]|uniref:Uncharacterized protein n=1 Tax=Citrobacter freundii TaxID=546 RepID=A0A7G2IHV0_CITFR|nr:hypothetical protein [Citrobacter freundii]